MPPWGIQTKMHTRIATITLSIVLGVSGARAASAQIPPGTLASASRAALGEPATDATARALPQQSPAAAPAANDDDLKVSIYPILLWVPTFSATATVPPFPDIPNGPDLPGGSGSTSASFDGAALAGVSIAKANWRVDADGIWAALTTTRERPLLNVDLDVTYGHVSGGVKVYKDLYLTGGVRRLALKYDIQLQDRPQHFTRKPGIWDPLIGLGWHGALGSRWTLHAVGEGGGFGVGADVDVSGTVRADVNLGAHLGLTFGYNAVYLKISDTVQERTFEVDQTLQGPLIGLGIYF